MADDEGICTEFSHSFLDHSSSYIVGYRCDSTWLFWGVVVLAVLLVIGQNVLATKDGQASRQALLTKKGSPERRRIIWKLLWYTFLASLLGTVHTLLVIGANVYILLALLLGNLAGVYFSYRQQQADEHDASADLCAVLRLAREHPDDEKWGHLRKDLRVFLQLSAPPTTPAPTISPTSPLELDYSCRSASRSLRARPAGTFAPYSDHPPSHSTEVTEEWAL